MDSQVPGSRVESKANLAKLSAPKKWTVEFNFSKHQRFVGVLIANMLLRRGGIQNLAFKHYRKIGILTWLRQIPQKHVSTIMMSFHYDQWSDVCCCIGVF